MAQSPNQSSQSERAARLAERFGMTRADIEHLLTDTHGEYANQPNRVVPPVVTPSETPVASSAQPRPLSGGALAVIFSILLIGLAIALSLKQGYFPQRSDRIAAAENRAAAKLADTTKNQDQSAAPFPPSVVPPGELPPESQVEIPRKIAHHVSAAAPRPLLQTSSEFEAEERLADLRADGNTKARIKSTRKHGTISYQIFSK